MSLAMSDFEYGVGKSWQTEGVGSFAVTLLTLMGSPSQAATDYHDLSTNLPSTDIARYSPILVMFCFVFFCFETASLCVVLVVPELGHSCLCL